MSYNNATIIHRYDFFFKFLGIKDCVDIKIASKDKHFRSRSIKNFKMHRKHFLQYYDITEKLTCDL